MSRVRANDLSILGNSRYLYAVLERLAGGEFYGLCFPHNHTPEQIRKFRMEAEQIEAARLAAEREKEAEPQRPVFRMR
jgi:hypothetical protein